MTESINSQYKNRRIKDITIIEPEKKLFRILKKNYSNKKFKIKNQINKKYKKKI